MSIDGRCAGCFVCARRECLGAVGSKLLKGVRNANCARKKTIWWRFFYNSKFVAPKYEVQPSTKDNEGSKDDYRYPIQQNPLLQRPLVVNYFSCTEGLFHRNLSSVKSRRSNFEQSMPAERVASGGR